MFRLGDNNIFSGSVEEGAGTVAVFLMFHFPFFTSKGDFS